VPLGVYVDRLLHRNVEHTDVIQPKRVINMVVGKQNSIAVSQFFPKHLLTKVWGCVNEYDSALRIAICKLNANTASKTFVFWIFTRTNITITSNNGYTRRGACAKKGE
jgi:hypothetical protein